MLVSHAYCSGLCVQMERTPLMAAAQNQSVDTVLVLAKEFNCKKKNYLDKVRV